MTRLKPEDGWVDVSRKAFGWKFVIVWLLAIALGWLGGYYMFLFILGMVAPG